MYYRFIFFIFFVSLKIISQEYEIKSENVEINTNTNKIIYTGDVIFKSNSISFVAESLVIFQENESIFASGNPIRINFDNDGEQIVGLSSELELVNSQLVLKKNVELLKSGNKIFSDNIVIQLTDD
tara:strand:- start:310 stop:687 length:378 start_codon:yes stop_codon:yes gene_type:complete